MPATPHLAASHAIHPLLWKANQLARSSSSVLDTGHATLTPHLPDGGWPLGSLTELLLDRPGIGELRLLVPALRRLPADRGIVLLSPPYIPCAQAWAVHGIALPQLLWITPKRPADAQWAAEQILKHGQCGALLFWAGAMATTSLRRLHHAAQASGAACFMFRPSRSAQTASPAPLRLQLHPAGTALRVAILKRRGPRLDNELLLPLSIGPSHVSPPPRYASMDQRLPDAAQSRRPESVLAQ